MKIFLFLSLIFLSKITYSYVLTNSKKGNNMKDTIQLVTIEVDNHKILRETQQNL